MYSLEEIKKMNSDSELIKNQKFLISGAVVLADNQNQLNLVNDYLVKSYNRFNSRSDNSAYAIITRRLNSSNP